MPRNQPRDLRARQLDETRAEHNIVAEIVDADHQAFERNERRRGREIRQRRFIRRPSETKDGNSRHPWQDSVRKLLITKLNTRLAGREGWRKLPRLRLQ